MRQLKMRARILVATILAAPVAAFAFSDPTQPSDFVGSQARAARSTPSTPTGPVLQSTLVSPQRRLAVISGRRVRVGDRLGGAVITGISLYEVRLKKDGRESTLRLLPKLNKDVEMGK